MAETKEEKKKKPATEAQQAKAAVREKAKKILEDFSKDPVIRAYYLLLVELTGRYDIDDINFVPHVLDRERLIAFIQTEMPTDNEWVVNLETNLCNTAERQIQLLAAGEVIPREDADTPRKRLFKVFSRHAVWLKVFASARRLWSARAFLPAQAEHRDRLSQRYGYYASSIAVFMNETRTMPPSELFAGLAATAPDFAAVNTDHDAETQHTVSTIPKKGGPALYAVRATKSIRASLVALERIATARLPKNATEIDLNALEQFAVIIREMESDFYGFISSPEKITRVRDVERLVLLFRQMRPDVDAQEDTLCIAALGVVRTVHERWLDVYDADPVDAALLADLKSSLQIVHDLVNLKRENPTWISEYVTKACSRFIRTCVEPLEQLPEEIKEILDKRKPQRGDPTKKKTTPLVLWKMVMAPNDAWRRLVALRKVQPRPPVEAREVFSGTRPGKFSQADVEAWKAAVDALNAEDAVEGDEEEEEEEEKVEEEEEGDE